MTSVATRPSLVVEELHAGYGRRPVLRGLTLPPIEAGELAMLVGPNGAGKSTLLRTLAGLLPATGSARLGELELIGASLGERAAQVAFMPQALPGRVSLTVLESVIGSLRATPTSVARRPAEVRRHAVAVLERIGIADIALEPLDRLSGGQRQLASLAQSMAREPKLLLLDEPTSALDLRHQVIVLELLRGLVAEGEGRIALVVTHDLRLAARWADTVVVMDRGRIHSAGSPEIALTAGMLSDVYGVAGRVERCSRGTLQVIVDALGGAVQTPHHAP